MRSRGQQKREPTARYRDESVVLEMNELGSQSSMSQESGLPEEKVEPVEKWLKETDLDGLADILPVSDPSFENSLERTRRDNDSFTKYE